MDDPKRAAGHFQRFRAVVADPDQPRARRLLARARPRAGRRPGGGASARFRPAPRTRRASTASSPPRRPAIAPTRGWPAAAPPDWREAAFSRRRRCRRRCCWTWRATSARASQFLRHAAERQPRRDPRGAGADGDRPRPARRSASASPRTRPREGVVLPSQYYPLHADRRAALAGADRVRDGDRPAGVGAQPRGRELRRRARADAADAGDGEGYGRGAGCPTTRDRLTEDPLYNARLGTEYLARMLDRYDGSYLLATAAYNAGPGRVDEWLETFGDPRDAGGRRGGLDRDRSRSPRPATT